MRNPGLLSKNNWILILSAFAIFSFQHISLAAEECKCKLSTIEQEIESSDVIFFGNVTKIEPFADSKIQNNSHLVTLDVSHVWKGEAQKEIKLIIPALECYSIDFEKGKGYFVYATKNKDNSLTISRCSRTNLVSNAMTDWVIVEEKFTPQPK